MPADWYCNVMGEESGPFTSEQLRDMADSRRLLSDSRVKKGKNGEWTLAVRVSGLFTQLGQQETATETPALGVRPSQLVNAGSGISERRARSAGLSGSIAAAVNLAPPNREDRGRRTLGLKYRAILMTAGAGIIAVAIVLVVRGLGVNGKNDPNAAPKPDGPSIPVIEVRPPQQIQVGRSGAEREPSEPPKVAPTIFRALRRAAKRIEGTVSVKPTYEQVKYLVQEMSTEFALASDEARTPDEKGVLSMYSDALDAYKDSLEIWDTANTVAAAIPGLQARYDRVVGVLAQAKRSGVDDPASNKILADHAADLYDDLSFAARGKYVPVGQRSPEYLGTQLEAVIKRQNLGVYVFKLGSSGGRTWLDLNAAVGQLWKKAANKLSEAGTKTAPEN